MTLTAKAQNALSAYCATERGVICAVLNAARGYEVTGIDAAQATERGWLAGGQVTVAGLAKLQSVFA